MSEHSTDYLIIGAGAAGIAFADTLLDETDATITIVDRRDKPGGHWNDAYPFVRLHQPSSFYGVASKELSSFSLDETGFNKGFEELASGQGVVAYFHDLMERKFLPSGRVTFLPMCEYSDEILKFAVSGGTAKVQIRRKLVDATFHENSIPLTHSRQFEVADGVPCIPPNDLPGRAWKYAHFTVLGGGKTAMDTVLWLLSRVAAHDQIRWIVPRDSWVINRASTQPGGAFFFENIGGFADQLAALSEAVSMDDLADRMQALGIWLRLSDEVRPDIMHGATLSPLEMQELRKIPDVVRLGRVKSIGNDLIRLVDGDCPAVPGTLYIDCTASALRHCKPEPIFESGRITLQWIRMYQPTFSAALLARIEALDMDIAAKNALAKPVPMSDVVADWVAGQDTTLRNSFAWMQVEALNKWIRSCRLDGFRRSSLEADKEDPKVRDTLEKMRHLTPKAPANIQKLLAA